MKRILVTLIITTCLALNAQGQDQKNAIGLRLGDSNGFGAAISYQRDILENNRLEFNFGWRNSSDYDGIKVIALYQWVWNIKNGLYWYAGPGAGFASYNFNSDYSDSFPIISGDIGIEYRFDFPLLVAFDIRPELGFGDDFVNNNDLDFDLGLAFRYRF